MSLVQDALTPLPDPAAGQVMELVASNPEGLSRTEARRAQILAAAADCFRQDGFHGASIAKISRAAGMSPGHIYHYFGSKEAIIAAIVEQDVARVLTLTAELRSARDVREAMIERVAEGIAEHLDPQAAALRLEIVAEAARNPDVAQTLRCADARALAGLAEMIRGVRRSAGHLDAEGTAPAMADTIAVLFEGLQIRAVRNPDLDPRALARIYRRLIQDLLNQPSDPDP